MNVASAALFQPDASAFVDDPYPTYAALREHAPVLPFVWEGREIWLFSRAEQVQHALVTWQDFTTTRGTFVVDSPARAGNTLATNDPPRHDELRRIYNRAFSAKRMRALEEGMRARARDLIARFHDKRSFELVNDFAKPLINRAIGDVIGIRESEETDTLALLAEVHSETSAFAAPIKLAALPTLNDFMLEQVRRRETETADDLMSILFEARSAGRFESDLEVAGATTMVLLAGFSTAVHFCGNLLSALHRHPDELAKVLADPTLIPAAIEEGARYDTAGQAFARSATRDMVVDGVPIPENGRVLLLYGSANRDELLCEDPDRYIVGRKPVRHFGFGSGPHFCLGAPLARYAVKIAMEELLPVIGQGFEPDYTTATRPLNIATRGFDRLDIAF